MVSEGRWHFDAGLEKQTLERFVEIYERAGEHLHVPNPFREASLARHQEVLATSRAQLVEDVEYLTNVLWTHAKVGLEFDLQTSEPREAANPISAWLVRLGKPDNDDVHIVLAEGVDQPVQTRASSDEEQVNDA